VRRARLGECQRLDMVELVSSNVIELWDWQLVGISPISEGILMTLETLSRSELRFAMFVSLK
jgi:hypothetical protein